MHRTKVPKRKAKPALRDTLASDIQIGISRGPSQRAPQPSAAQSSQAPASGSLDEEPYPYDPADNPDSISTRPERIEQSHPPQQTSAWTRYRPDVQRAYICKLTDAGKLQRQLVATQQDLLQQAVNLLLGSCPKCQSTSTSPIHFGSSQVLVIDLSHSFRLTIPATTCNGCWHRFSVRPVDVGCFPSTPVHSWDLLQGQGQQEQIWFRVSMMHFLDQLVQTQRRVSYDRMTETILRTHDCTESGHSVSYDSLRKKLSDAVREFGCMQTHLGDMQELGVAGWPAGPLAGCAACWQPPSAGGGQNLHSLNIDFNFKVPHLKNADSRPLGEQEEAPSVRNRFIPDSEAISFLELAPELAAEPEPTEKACSDFSAAQALGRKSTKYDITALGAALCRHGQVVCMMNCYTGERYAYANLLVKRLLEQGVCIQFIWYDINCKWKVAFQRFILTLPAAQQQLVSGTQFPVPPWHLFAHSTSCQQQNGAVLMVGAGRGNGEPHEIFNSQIGPHGRTTQYMLRHHREDVIERAVQHLSDSTSLKLPAMLQRQQVRAKRQRAEAQQEARSVLAILMKRGLSNAEIKTMLQGRNAREAESQEPSRTWQAEYAYHKLILHQAEMTQGDALPGMDLLLPSAAVRQLAPGSSRVKTARRQASKLEQEHLEGQPMDVQDDAFKPMTAALALHEVQCLQQQLAIKVASRMDADSQLNALASDRPNDVKRLRRQLQSASAVIQKLMDRLATWLQHPYLPRNELSRPLQMAQESVHDWDLSAFQQGRFPWEHGHDLSQTLSQDQLLSRLQLYLNQQQRAEEEMAMLKAEQQTSLTNYQLQQSALHVAIQKHEQLHAAQEAAAAGMAAESRAWHSGVCMLLRKKLAIVSKIQGAAQRAFGSSDSSPANGAACLESYETILPNDTISDDDSQAGDK